MQLTLYLNSIWKTILLAGFIGFLTSCGNQISERHTKQYNFYITETNFPAKFRDQFKTILDKINSATGLRRFQITDNLSKANSFLNLTDTQRYFGSETIGAGAPTYRFVRHTPSLDLIKDGFRGLKAYQSISHGMDIDIDRSWAINNVLPEHSPEGVEITNFAEIIGGFSSNNYGENIAHSYPRIPLFESLILHEIGHGLNFNHVNSPENVMFEFISNRKNLSEFYQKIRTTLLSNSY